MSAWFRCTRLPSLTSVREGRKRSSQGVPPLDPVNGTAAAVLKFATPQRVRRPLPELTASRRLKQAGRFVCPHSGQIPSRARSEWHLRPPGPIVMFEALNCLQVSPGRNGRDRSLLISPGETSQGLQLIAEAEAFQ